MWGVGRRVKGGWGVEGMWGVGRRDQCCTEAGVLRACGVWVKVTSVVLRLGC